MDGENIECWLTDMDGVLVQEHQALPGAAELLEQWRRKDLPYLVLTNNSIFTARDLSARLRQSGLIVPE
ncbi:MAG: TIGR01457 family HAD-type hydrolase, partial [Nesterenkonia sp.]